MNVVHEHVNLWALGAHIQGMQDVHDCAEKAEQGHHMWLVSNSNVLPSTVRVTAIACMSLVGLTSPMLLFATHEG